MEAYHFILNKVDIKVHLRSLSVNTIKQASSDSLMFGETFYWEKLSYSSYQKDFVSPFQVSLKTRYTFSWQQFCTLPVTSLGRRMRPVTLQELLQEWFQERE